MRTGEALQLSNFRDDISSQRTCRNGRSPPVEAVDLDQCFGHFVRIATIESCKNHYFCAGEE